MAYVRQHYGLATTGKPTQNCGKTSSGGSAKNGALSQKSGSGVKSGPSSQKSGTK